MEEARLTAAERPSPAASGGAGASTASQAIAGLQALAASLRGLMIPDRLPPSARLSLISQLEDDARENLARVLDHPAGLPSRGLAGWPRLADEACAVSGMLLDAYAGLAGQGGASEDVAEQIDLRLCAAAAQRVKWEFLSCGPRHATLWRLIGELRGRRPEHRALHAEYLRAVAYASCGMDQIPPNAVGAVDRLIDLLLPHLSLLSSPAGSSLYGIVPADGEPPRRLVEHGEQMAGMLHLIPGAAVRILNGLSGQLAQGSVPAELAGNGRHGEAGLALALQTLLRHWSSMPPLRRYRRHLLDGRLEAVRGFDELKTLLQGGACTSASGEWQMYDVSRGGIGALVPRAGDDAVQMGDLVGLRSADGDAWHLGIVRRKRATGEGRLVGVETVSQRPEIISADDGRAAAEVLLCDPLLKGEAVRVLVSPDALMSGVPLFVSANGGLHKLKPLDAAASGRDFELRVYQVL
ncbi:hypothetical protein E6C76_13225 [Pseudothauera nasutitermitis]|uniref:PilZ domain-containing protein n=1 Tax=Pseudothauera nasutitermitis TaxID=2565930 RepID=A0A4S4AWD3_9RHOO|nr:hypothetical protein [Pseudothauera nasutitermitis]THF63555.1 hypothetical protein E6C76_13225 [Pseudothauera nasutitermitis]